jgi:hypothetical protein
MKNFYTIMAYIILSIASTRLSAADFLDDPFFKQLASELDAMFGKTDEDALLPGKKPGAPTSPFSPRPEPLASLNSAKNSKPESLVGSDSSKDLKTLFIESLSAPKPQSSSSYGIAAKKQKILISAKKKESYHYYMDSLVKKIRLIERITASNPGRVFSPSFLVWFDTVINSIDQIDAYNHLISSKKMYLRTFFGQPLQKTREQIIALQPKLDTILKKFNPLIHKEESLDEDISSLQREARKSGVKTRLVTPSVTKAKKAAIQSRNIKAGAAGLAQAKPRLPGYVGLADYKKIKPVPKSNGLPTPRLSPDFSLRDFMNKGAAQ